VLRFFGGLTHQEIADHLIVQARWLAEGLGRTRSKDTLAVVVWVTSIWRFVSSPSTSVWPSSSLPP
jgi:hypothetical protein